MNELIIGIVIGSLVTCGLFFTASIKLKSVFKDVAKEIDKQNLEYSQLQNRFLDTVQLLRSISATLDKCVKYKQELTKEEIVIQLNLTLFKTDIEVQKLVNQLVEDVRQKNE